MFIADPHLRESNINQTREIIREINDLHPSLVLIGGDFTYDDERNLSYQDVWSEIDAPVYARDRVIMIIDPVSMHQDVGKRC